MHLIIDSAYDEQTLREIDRGLQFLLQTPKGSYPLDREFGIDFSFLDKPAPVAANLLAADLKDVIPAMDPRVELDRVEMKRDDLNGKLLPTIYLRGADTDLMEEESDE
nr:MAG TPA_asm: lysozyme [Caudoviricetes sp.]